MPLSFYRCGLKEVKTDGSTGCEFLLDKAKEEKHTSKKSRKEAKQKKEKVNILL